MMTGTADQSGGPTLRYRVRCQSCDFSERFRSRADAIRVQKHGCPECGHGVGVSRVRADPDDQQLMTDGGEPDGPWPITVTLEVLNGKPQRIIADSDPDYLLDHSSGSLKEDIYEVAKSEIDRDGEVELTVAESGHVEVADAWDTNIATDGGTCCQDADSDRDVDRDDAAECACPLGDCDGDLFLANNPEDEFWYYCNECETNLSQGDRIRFEMPTASFAGRIVAVSKRGTIRVRSVTTVDIEPDQVTAKLEEGA